jgi:hypothetical protein
MWYKIKAAITSWFGNVKVYKYPFFILTGHTAYKIKGELQRGILNTLEPGDVLLRRYDNYLSGLIIPGYFTHAAVYVGDDQIIHVLGSGICREDILTFLRCDDINILRVKDAATSQAAVKNAWAQLGKDVGYDFDFDANSPELFYCTEFVDFCFSYPVRDKVSKDYILPDDFLESDVFYSVWSK